MQIVSRDDGVKAALAICGWREILGRRQIWDACTKEALNPFMVEWAVGILLDAYEKMGMDIPSLLSLLGADVVLHLTKNLLVDEKLHELLKEDVFEKLSTIEIELTSYLSLKTRFTMSGLWVQSSPGRRAAVISGHLGLPVMVIMLKEAG